MKRLLCWISKLGERKQHCALIVADAGTPFDDVMQLRELAETIFREVRVTTNGHTVAGWPDGANSLFLAAARHCAEPFFWLESDCVPMRAGWLDDISTGWDSTKATRLFMGHIYDCTQPFLPSKVMSGVAVYSPEGISKLPFLKNSPRAWDVDGAEVMVTNGAHTPLISHFWGQLNLPPTFVARKDAHSPVNAMTLEDIPPAAALFHRNKDGTLIRLLERKFFPHEFREKIAVCFPVYQGDIGLATLHANWMVRMGRRHEHKAIICHDPSCPVVLLNQFELLLRQCFSEVESCVYARPPIPTYPAAANFAFQSVACHMAKQKSPWLFFEADMVALKPDWLEQIQAEYDACGRSWMGAVVHQMGHFNGTAVYPSDAAARMPHTMNCGANEAFDMLARHDAMHDVHDCGHLMFHCWSVLNGEFCPVGGGQVPMNISVELANKIPKSAVTIHRIKSGLIELLMRGEFRP